MNPKILILAATVAVLGHGSASAQDAAMNVAQPAVPVAVAAPIPPGAMPPPPPVQFAPAPQVPPAPQSSMAPQMPVAATAVPPPSQPNPIVPSPQVVAAPPAPPSMPPPQLRSTGRDNPFLPTYSDKEQAQIDREDERRRDIQEMIPELRQALIPEIRSMIEAERKTASPEVKVEGDPLAAALAGAAGEGITPLAGQVPGSNPDIPGAPGAVAGDPAVVQAASLDVGRPLPVENATFIACVDKKALYRDSSGVIFLADKNSTTCSR